MTRAEVLAELREVLNDKVSPYGWSDKRLLHFLSLGQDQFCKDTGFFRDAGERDSPYINASFFHIPYKCIAPKLALGCSSRHCAA